MLTLTAVLSAIDESRPEKRYAFGPSCPGDRLALLNLLACPRLAVASQNDVAGVYQISAVTAPMAMDRTGAADDIGAMRDPAQQTLARELRRDVLDLTRRGGVILVATLS